ncbi:MAG TPA: hypothetical protein VMP89_06205, partial [Solirubrobacteraceae bacterium]|nr:hypothetical protein [Solirubrobacteraceae bacterium]
MTYLESLGSELARVGIGGRLRSRILLEIGDHLECDPEAALGEPAALARQFADELGTARARRAAFATFGVLALVAGLLAAAFVSSRAIAGVVWPRTHRHSVLLGDLAVVLLVICAQVAFVAGLLAAARALHRRSDPVLPHAEATVIGRRAIVALLAGIGTLAGLALVAVEYDGAVPTWWRIAAGTAAGVGICALAALAVAVRSALRVKPTAPGAAGDVFEDVGP